MNYRETFPSKNLAGYIKRFWSLEYNPTGHASEPETVLPDGCPEIVFNLSDRFERINRNGREIQPSTLFAGQMMRSIVIRPTGRVRLFGVRFHPTGAFPLGGFSMHEMTDQTIGVDSVLGSDGSELEARIREAESFESRIAAFEMYFVRKLAALQRDDDVASYAASLIVGSGGLITISRLSESLGVSERRLERRFRSRVGISPKMLARIVRFQSLLGLIQKAKTPGILDASLELGYYDQSHAIRDFREFSGTTPLGYFQMTHGLSDVFTSVVAKL
jgi:AraC-like DNA-binding protein